MSKGGGQPQRTTQSGTTNNVNSSMSNFNQNQYGQQSLDPNSQAYVDWQRQLAQGGANQIAGINQLTAGPNQYMEQALGLLAHPGGGSGYGGGQVPQGPDAALIQKYLNPYQSNVVDATRGEFDYLRGAANTQAKQDATLQGAYGGSRAAVAQGARLGELDRAQASQIAGLNQQGYGQALDAAFRAQDQQNAGNIGLAGAAGGAAANDLQRAQLLFGLGNQYRDIQSQQNYDPIAKYQAALGIASAGLGPTGTFSSGGQSGTSNQTGTESGVFNSSYTQPRPQSNVAGGVLGGAAVGSTFGVPGALIGGAIGGIGSLFRRAPGASPSSVMAPPGGGYPPVGDVINRPQYPPQQPRTLPGGLLAPPGYIPQPTDMTNGGMAPQGVYGGLQGGYQDLLSRLNGLGLGGYSLGLAY